MSIIVYKLNAKLCNLSEKPCNNNNNNNNNNIFAFLKNGIKFLKTISNKVRITMMGFKYNYEMFKCRKKYFFSYAYNMQKTLNAKNYVIIFSFS